jgi:hypothetical protein
MTNEQRWRIDSMLADAAAGDEITRQVLADLLADSGSEAILHVLRRCLIDVSADPLETLRTWAFARGKGRMARNVINAVTRAIVSKCAGYLTVRDLANCSCSQLQLIPGLCGKGSIKLAREFLASRNLMLKGE